MRNRLTLDTIVRSTFVLAIAAGAPACAMQPAEADADPEVASASQAMCAWSSSVAGTLSATSSVSATSPGGYATSNCGWFVVEGDVTHPPLGEGAQLTVTSVVAKPDLLRCSSLRASYLVQGFANGAWSTLTSGFAYGSLVNPGAPFGSQQCVATFTDSIAATQAAQYSAFRMGGSATATGATTWSPPVTVAVHGWAF